MTPRDRWLLLSDKARETLAHLLDRGGPAMVPEPAWASADELASIGWAEVEPRIRRPENLPPFKMVSLAAGKVAEVTEALVEPDPDAEPASPD